MISSRTDAPKPLGTNVFLDTSAILAVLLDEPGGAFVKPHLRGGEVSIINICEVLTKAAEQGGDIEVIQATLDSYGFRVRAFRDAHARESALLRPATKHMGLGLGDRACRRAGQIQRTADPDG